MDLKTFILPLLKWWWLIALATLVAGISSYLSVSQQPPIYQSRTTLMVGRVIDNPNPSNADFSVGQQLAATYVNIANTQQMRARTMEALGLQQMPEYVVQPVPSTELIAIIVTDTSPERAQAVANELARQLVLQSPTTPSQEEQERNIFVEEQLADLQTNIQSTQEEIEAWQEQLNELISARELDDAQTQIGALEVKLNTLQSIYASLLSTTERGASNTVRIIDAASLPVRPIGPRIAVTVLTAASVGFALAAAAAYVLEYLDDTVKRPAEIERISGLPTLTAIGRFQATESKGKLITVTDPRSSVSEAFRALRTAIQFSNLHQESRALLITSPNPVEGKSLVVANLGIVLAQAGHKVLLIDADLHRPAQHRLFDLANRQGLTTLILPLLLQEDAPGEAVLGKDVMPARGTIQATSQFGLYVLTSGPLPEHPSELLGSHKMKLVLDWLYTKFDYVILDSPPVLAVTDATILSTRVDSVMVLVDVKQTRRKQLRETVAQLRKVGANLTGVILNRVPASSADYPSYHSYHGYRYLDGQHEGEHLGNNTYANGNGSIGGLLGRLRHKKRV